MVCSGPADTASRFCISCVSQCCVVLSSRRQLANVESFNWSGRHWRSASRALKSMSVAIGMSRSGPERSRQTVQTWDYPTADCSNGSRASVIGPTVPWPTAEPFYPAGGRRNERLSKWQAANSNRGVRTAQTGHLQKPHQNHSYMRETLVGLADVGQSRLVQENLLQNEGGHLNGKGALYSCSEERQASVTVFESSLPDSMIRRQSGIISVVRRKLITSCSSV